MDLFDVVVAKKLAGGSGGGGGSSDFNTAQVTLIPEEGHSYGLYAYESQDYPYGFTGIFMFDGQFVYTPNCQFEEGTEHAIPTTFTLYYVGDSYECYGNYRYISSTGNVVYDSDTEILTITGDCTITGSDG